MITMPMILFRNRLFCAISTKPGAAYRMMASLFHRNYKTVFLRLALAPLAFAATSCSESPPSVEKGALPTDSAQLQEIFTGEIIRFPKTTLSGDEQQYLRQVVRDYRMVFNEEQDLLQGGGGAADTRKHVIRWSLEYALVLLGSGDEVYRQRALRVIDRVLAQQVTDPASRHYGNWPKFLEEPLVDNQRADGNQADFIAWTLLEMLHSHAEQLPEDLQSRMKDALHVAGNYIKKRTIRPTYTNAYAMGFLNLIGIGEMLDLPELRQIGREHLRDFHRLTLDQGSYTEYHSPNYTVLVLNILYTFLQWVEDPQSLGMASDLYRFTWQYIGNQYHVPTRQWAGPHSRNRGGEEILSAGYAALLSAAIQGEKPEAIPPGSHGAASNLNRRHAVPEALRPLFNESRPREHVTTYWRVSETARELAPDSDISFDFETDIIGTTYLGERFALGTVNRGQFWEQRRNLLAHWSVDESVGYMQLEFLKDGFPFATVQHFAVQAENRTLVAANFATDGGDKHLYLDSIRGRFTASDLRLRLNFGGAGGKFQVTRDEATPETIKVRSGDIVFQFQAPVAFVDGEEGRWEHRRHSGNLWVDLVFHKGEKKLFDLDKVADSFIGLALLIHEVNQEETLGAIEFSTANERLSLDWDGLSLSVPTRPGVGKQLQKDYDASVRGQSRRILHQ